MSYGPWPRAAVLLLVGAETAACAACVELSDTDQEVILWEAELLAEAQPDLTGQAAAVSGVTGTDVGIGLAGAEPSVSYGWRARLGTCAAPGEQVGPSSDYPILEVGATGAAAAETHLGPRFRRDGQYQVEVHGRTSDSTRIACGNLVAR